MMLLSRRGVTLLHDVLPKARHVVPALISDL